MKLGHIQMVVMAFAIIACGCSQRTRYVTSRGFSFQSYDYIVVSKPSGFSLALYGIDLELANYLASYNFNIVGDTLGRRGDIAHQPRAQQQAANHCDCQHSKKHFFEHDLYPPQGIAAPGCGRAGGNVI